MHQPETYTKQKNPFRWEWQTNVQTNRREIITNIFSLKDILSIPLQGRKNRTQIKDLRIKGKDQDQNDNSRRTWSLPPHQEHLKNTSICRMILKTKWKTASTFFFILKMASFFFFFSKHGIHFFPCTSKAVRWNPGGREEKQSDQDLSPMRWHGRRRESSLKMNSSNHILDILALGSKSRKTSHLNWLENQWD